MFPHRTDWRHWTPLEKVGYVAQLAAAISLLPTTAFAWLTWREARLAREDQRVAFSAEKIPKVTIRGLELRDHIDDQFGALSITVVNDGLVEAKRVRIQAYVFDQRHDIVPAESTAKIESLLPGDSKWDWLIMGSELRKGIGYVPTRARAVRPELQEPAVGSRTTMPLRITYEDPFGVKREQYLHLEAYRE